MNTIFLYKYNNSKELPEKLSCLPHRKGAAERPKATQLTRYILAATFTPQKGRSVHYLTCPLDFLNTGKPKATRSRTAFIIACQLQKQN